jgi:hypothetical protein
VSFYLYSSFHIFLPYGLILTCGLETNQPSTQVLVPLAPSKVLKVWAGATPRGATPPLTEGSLGPANIAEAYKKALAEGVRRARTEMVLATRQRAKKKVLGQMPGRGDRATRMARPSPSPQVMIRASRLIRPLAWQRSWA